MIQPNDVYAIHHGDCIEHMATMPESSVDMSVFSPPFPSLYAYTGSDRDIGNSEDLTGDGKLHLSFFYRQLARIVKPGRVVMVHVMQIPRMKRTGGLGIFDFRGLNIRLAERAGLVYEYDWAVRKNPQAQAIRTKSRELQFSGLESDRSKTRGTLLDYLIKFRAPGENQTPIVGHNQVTRNQWIEWAEGCWTDIKETDTLNVRGTKGEEDTKHICPLQLGVIERLVRLFSNPGELVFSPFTGIGSEGYMAVKLGRRFYGCELKDEYYKTAHKNLAKALKEHESEVQRSLFPEFEPVEKPQPKPETAVVVVKPVEVPVISFPCSGVGAKEWHLTEKQAQEWSSAYPAVDVIGEARKALAWINANPTKKKTARGMPAFLVRWLGKVQDNKPMPTQNKLTFKQQESKSALDLIDRVCNGSETPALSGGYLNGIS